MSNKSANYEESRVVAQLSRKHDIYIEGSTIQILWGKSAKGDVGIKSKGKIDFLIRYHGYSKFFTQKFT